MKRFKPGQRVKMEGYDFYSGVMPGDVGTVAEVATCKGKSCYPDPAKLLLFVRWDTHGDRSVWRKLVEMA